MKILKIFGLVVGVHLVALIMIFANPGCTATTKPPPSPGDTVAKTDPAPLSVPMAAPASSTPPSYAPAPAPSLAAAAPAFDPNAPASSSGSGGVGVRFTPTRPNTPAASTLVTEPVTDVTPTTTYTVKSGDTLWDLQKKFGVPYQQIAAANGIKTNAALHAGQKLMIPQKGATAAVSPAAGAAPRGATVAPGQTGPGATAPVAATPAPAPVNNGKDVMKHTVQSGETLGAIARRYGVRATDIAVANHITDPAKVPAGKELIIPGWEPKGPKQGGTKSGDTKQSSPAGNVEATQQPVTEPAILRLDQAPPPTSPFTPAPRN